MNKIEIITPPDMDYFVFKYNDEEYYAGDEIPQYIWLELFDKNNVEIVETELSDDDFNERYS